MVDVKKDRDGFVKSTKYPQSNLSNYLKGRTKNPQLSLVIAIAGYFKELNLRWWLLGEGPMEQQQIGDEERQRMEERIQGLEREVRLAEKAYEAMKELAEEYKEQLKMKDR